MSFARRGFTLLETLVVAGILLTVTAIASSAFESGVLTLSKINARADYVQSFQVLGSNFVRDTQASRRQALDFASNAYACPSPQRSEGPQISGLEPGLNYQSYRLYSRRPVERDGWLRSLPLTSPSAEVLPLSEADVGWGIQGLGFYTGVGKMLVTDLDILDAHSQGAAVVLHLRGTRHHHGRSAPETVDISFWAYPRNSN